MLFNFRMGSRQATGIKIRTMPVNSCLDNDYIRINIVRFKTVALETKRYSHFIHHPFVIGAGVPVVQVFTKKTAPTGIRVPFPFLAVTGIVAGISLHLPAGLWDKDVVPGSLAIPLRKTGCFASSYTVSPYFYHLK